MDDLISKLSEIRSDYNCFDADEEPYYRALSEAIRILSQWADGDTISRQAAIDALRDAENHAFNSSYKGLAKARKIIADLPSVQPERKMGKWIYNSPVTMKCDQCGFVIKDWDWHRFKFCPNCGADMRGEQDG